MTAYRELTAKVDAFFTRVAARHGDQMDCATGCADCCGTELSVLGVEAAAVTACVAALPAETRGQLGQLARRAPASAPRCAALGDDDRCLIYAGRPLVCRSHGVPVRLRDPRSLPVVEALVTACERNFRAAGPAAADADCILDQLTLSTVLLAIDAEHAAAHAPGRAGERVRLRDLLIALT